MRWADSSKQHVQCTHTETTQLHDCVALALVGTTAELQTLESLD
jgi:hypothetical protein